MRLYQILTVLLFLAAARAAEETAIVDEGRINVRGKPSLIGEVVTQLERGEKVTVLERITNSTPRPGDSTNWAKIKFPNNTPVWVFAPFVKDGVVAVSRLNVRAGHSENYSVLGRLNRGEPVKQIRTVDEWMEIEPPTNAYAFVDLDLLQFEGQPPRQPRTTPPVEVTQAPATQIPATQIPATQTPTTSVETAPPLTAQPELAANPVADVPTNTTETVTATTPNIVSEQPATIAQPETVITQPPVATVEPQPTETQPEPVTIKPELEPAPATAVAEVPAVEESAPAILPEKLPEVAPPIEKPDVPLPKRVVRREGVVRATTSIQAPTWYELVHADTKKRINYLFDENLGLNLKDYRGQRVVVSGEEAIDPRWPNTPILDMQTLDVLPDATR